VPLDEAAPIGRIRWSIRDTELNEIVSSGVKVLQARDFTIEILEHDVKLSDFTPRNMMGIPALLLSIFSPPMLSKKFELNEPFTLALSHHDTPKLGLHGFLLSVVKEGEKQFGAGWFDIENRGTAVQRVPKGTLSTKVQLIDGRPELIKTVCLTDIHLWIPHNREGQSREEADEAIRDPRWIMDIEQGSIIHWPSLIDGELVPNGFL
jgi:hypothetical protein